MYHKVEKVETLPAFVIRIQFKNGMVKYYKVSSLFEKWDVFKELKDIPGLFDQVKVDTGGYGISWNDHIDLECNELWEYGKETMSDLD